MSKITIIKPRRGGYVTLEAENKDSNSLDIIHEIWDDLQNAYAQGIPDKIRKAEKRYYKQMKVSNAKIITETSGSQFKR